MEFHFKLQELRKQKGLTQEELAEQLYVSRTAISKWESGRGYPNIESLKAIAKFFSVTVDRLLSSDEVLEIAQQKQRQTRGQVRDLVFGLLDICMALLLFLPFFADRTMESIQAVSLLGLYGAQPYLKICYLIAVFGSVAIGILTLALQFYQDAPWCKFKTVFSMTLSGVTVLLFVLGLQPYAAVFALTLWIIKLLMLIKRE